LQIKLPMGQTFVLAILILMTVWGVSEAAVRIFLIGTGSPAPHIGSLNAELDIKLSMLDALEEQKGQIDCIFLGSSQLDTGVDPEVFSRQFEENVGFEPVCFNFSLATLTASPAGVFAEILIRRYQPVLLIYGTSARDYSTNFGEWSRDLLQDPWVRYSLGEFDIRGWLIENSYAFRIPVFLKQQLSPDYRTFLQELSANLTEFGAAQVYSTNLSITKENFIPEYVRSSQDMEGLETLLALNGDATQVIVIEVPVHDTFLPHYLEADEEKYTTEFLIPISELVQLRGVPFWASGDQMQELIPDEGWNDTRHLNVQGAKIFSAWLADRLAEDITEGVINDPFNE
jgi:hypothetical protein